MNDEIKKELENEVNSIWEKDLKEEIVKKMDVLYKALFEDINEKFNNLTEEIKQKSEKMAQSFELEKIKPKNYNYNMCLEYIEITNNLLNPILISLMNINSFDYICLKNENILNFLNEKKPKNVLSLIIQLLNSKIKEKKNLFDPTEIHKQLKSMMDEKFDSENPSVFINFILTNLVEELNFKENLSLKICSSSSDEEVKINLESIKNNFNNEFFSTFFTTHKRIYKCHKCKNKEFIYEKIPIIKLFINEPIEDDIQLNIPKSKKDELNEIELNKAFSFLLNNNESNEIKWKCQNCKEESKALKTKTIEEMSDILILELNRDNDKNMKMNVKYESLLKLNESPNKYELISVLMKKKIISYKNYYLIDPNYEIFTYFKNFIDNKWYLYNEEKIELVEKEEEIFDNKNAIILIYKKY